MPDFKELARRRMADQKTAGEHTGAPAELPEEERHYKAFRSAVAQSRIALTVRLSNGDRMHYPYGLYQGGVFYASGEYAQLDFGVRGLLHLWGRRLTEIEDMLGNGDIRALEEFDAARWGEPPAGEPVIIRVEFQLPGEKEPEELGSSPPAKAQH